MRRLLLFFADRPWLGLGLLLLASLLAATQIDRLEVRVSADEMLVVGDPQRTYYDEVKSVFGEEQIVLLIVEDGQLLAPPRLAALRTVLDIIEALPFVDRTESLFNVPYVRSVDGYLKKDAYLAAMPESDEAEAASD